nr:hypothetical protein Iba_chr05aCG0800 [Ipomoea batatas]GMC93215.1 hypothetical protein Iba_chr05bCG0220 [Ipomoea batatas]GMC94663.1 hypothetical protein Iba_chr05cCG1170 [Ipomoea batatas]GMC96682.1 hypothetical protein Iba_chr05dCG0250 [Ipomoea batatas]GMC98862.1 hypothetical protein Iba_chr05eCG0190 [Ipomoea batatas]
MPSNQHFLLQVLDFLLHKHPQFSYRSHYQPSSHSMSPAVFLLSKVSSLFPCLI